MIFGTITLIFEAPSRFSPRDILKISHNEEEKFEFFSFEAIKNVLLSFFSTPRQHKMNKKMNLYKKRRSQQHKS